MSTPNVPFKTPLGHDELRTRTHRLSQRHRTILLLVDGRRPVAEVLSLAQQAGSSISHFEDVLRMGLVELPIDVLAPDPVMTEPGVLATLRTTAVEVDVGPDTVPSVDAEPAVTVPLMTVRTSDAAGAARVRGVTTDDAAMLPAALMVTQVEPVAAAALAAVAQASAPTALEPDLGEPEPVSSSVEAAPAATLPEPLHEPPPDAVVHIADAHEDGPPAEPPVLFEAAVVPNPTAGDPVATQPSPAAPAAAAVPEPPARAAVVAHERVPAVAVTHAPSAAAATHQPAAAAAAQVPAAPVRSAAAPQVPAAPVRSAAAPQAAPSPLPAAPRRRGGRPAAAPPPPQRTEPVTLSELAHVPAPDLQPAPAAQPDDVLVEQVRELLAHAVRQNPPPFVSRLPSRVSAAKTVQELRDLVLDIERYMSARRPRAGVAGLQQARELLGLGNTVVAEDSRSWVDDGDDDGTDVFRTTR